jgi:hypothetical protein
MRTLTLALLAAMLLGACSARNVVELNTVNRAALQTTGSFYVLPLEIDFRPPQAWEIADDEWDLWIEHWKLDYRKELKDDCYKNLVFIDSADEADGAIVRCVVYEMDKGGFSGFGGNGFARAHITVTDRDGKAIYDAKLEGTGANSGFESAVVRGRMKFAVLNLARQIADVLENGE